MSAMSEMHAELGVGELEDRIETLESELAHMRETWWSDDDHERAIDAEREAAYADAHSEWARDFGDLSETAHRLLGDLAHRAVTGDSVAAAIELEMRDFLEAVRDAGGK